METVIAYTVITWGILFGAGWLFDRRIDGTPVEDRPDGLTAYWVGIGCSYTLIGAAVVVTLWRPFLPDGFGFGVVAFALMLATFGAAGLPLLAGSIRRSHAQRRMDAEVRALLAAKRTLEDLP